MKQFYVVIVLIFLALRISFSQSNPTLSIPTVCEGNDMILVILNPIAGVRYQITGPNGYSKETTSDTLIIRSVTMAYEGEYLFYVSGTLQGSTTATIRPKPIADFTMDREHAIMENQPVRINFYDHSINAAYWRWNFGDIHSSENESFLQSPSHEFTREGKYQVSLTVQSFNGCTDIMSKVVTIDLPFHFFIPNSFSPNDDGINDEFCVKGKGFILENFLMRIYNKDNVLVYKSEYIYDCWDGRHKGKYCPTGVYTAIIQVTTADREVKEYIVPITLIR